MARAACQRRAVGDAPPAAVAVALGQEDALGRRARPLLQPFAEAPRIGPQRLPRAQHAAAVGPLLDLDVGWGEERRSHLSLPRAR